MVQTMVATLLQGCTSKAHFDMRYVHNNISHDMNMAVEATLPS